MIHTQDSLTIAELIRDGIRKISTRDFTVIKQSPDSFERQTPTHFKRQITFLKDVSVQCFSEAIQRGIKIGDRRNVIMLIILKRNNESFEISTSLEFPYESNDEKDKNFTSIKVIYNLLFEDGNIYRMNESEAGMKQTKIGYIHSGILVPIMNIMRQIKSKEASDGESSEA